MYEGSPPCFLLVLTEAPSWTEGLKEQGYTLGGSQDRDPRPTALDPDLGPGSKLVSEGWAVSQLGGVVHTHSWGFRPQFGGKTSKIDGTGVLTS